MPSALKMPKTVSHKDELMKALKKRKEAIIYPNAALMDFKFEIKLKKTG